MVAQGRTLVLASANPGKAREIDELLAPRGIRVVTISSLVPGFDVVEDGTTFSANAALKAMAGWDQVARPVLADDSGLCVQALDGGPGIHSSRYGGAGATDQDKYRKLLSEPALVRDQARRAWFECAMVAVLPKAWLVREPVDGVELKPGPDRDHSLVLATGRLEGMIGLEPRGSDGFGYDPVFIPDDFGGKTLAELGAEVKNGISHRGRALEALARVLA